MQKRHDRLGQGEAQNWLTILNDHWIGKKDYLAATSITIADYFGVCLVTLGELIGCEFSDYPNVKRWIGNMKKLKSWAKVNEVHVRLRRIAEGPAVRQPSEPGVPNGDGT